MNKDEWIPCVQGAIVTVATHSRATNSRSGTCTLYSCEVRSNKSDSLF